MVDSYYNISFFKNIVLNKKNSTVIAFKNKEV